MIMRFRPANISLINRRHYLPRLLLTLSSFEKKRPAHLDRSLHITSEWMTNQEQFIGSFRRAGFVSRRELTACHRSRNPDPIVVENSPLEGGRIKFSTD